MTFIARSESCGFRPFLNAFGIPLFFFSCMTPLHAFYSSGAYPKELDPQYALIGPSRAQAGQPLDLQLVALGKDGNPCDPTTAPLILCVGPQLPDQSLEPKSITIPLRRVEAGIFKPETPPVLKEEGYYLLTAQDEANAFLPFGLPIHVTKEAPALQLHWGDLHGHSTLSDGARPAEDYYRWARDVARLDMVALTDHNWALDEAKVAKVRALAKEWYDPGRFVTFFSMEWAEGKARPQPARGRPNHKQLLFRNVDEALSPWGPWNDTPSVRYLWEMCEGRDVIAIPHHTGLPHATYFGTDWSQHNPKFERVAEIFSDWGSSEMPDDRYPLPEKQEGNFVRDALARGYHLGMAGGSDTHTSRPGLNAIPHQGHVYALTALTAVEAPARTRDDVWKALYDRRCYATSGGRRTLLEFTLNGQPMGSQITLANKDEKRRLSIVVAGSSDIIKIVIVKNGAHVLGLPGKGWLQQFEITDPFQPTGNEDYYYIRAEMKDTSMAWSSPIWVATAGPTSDVP